MAKVALLCISLMGGGALGSIANAVELSTIASCADGSTNCTITNAYDNQSVENSQNLTLNGNITIQSTLTNLTNNGTLRVNQINSANNPLELINNGTINGTATGINTIQGYITNLTNSGTISGSTSIIFPTTSTATITNTGTMNGISAESNGRVIIDNRSNIYLYSTNVSVGDKLAHLKGGNGTQFMIRNYAIKINENQQSFNGFSGYTYADSASLNHNSHLVITGNQVSFNNIAFESNAKITIDFGRDFELGKAYSIAKIITDIDGNGLLPTSYFDRLISKDKDFYTITQSGDNFILNFAGGDAPSGGIIINTPITELYKSNIKTMNNFFLQSNAVIYPRKYGSKIAPKKNLYNPHRNRYSLNELDFLKSNEAFFYKDSRESGVIQAILDENSHESSAIQAIQSNDSQDSPLFLAQSATYRNSQRGIYMQYPKVNPQNNAGFSANQTHNRTAPNRPSSQSASNYYFALVPFVNHNLYYQAGNYQLSGLDYGFIGAFSGKLNNANALGAHLGFSYGTLGDKNDSVFSAKSINFMLGLNYKLDLIYDMFVKARGDFFYFANEISTAQVAHTKPNDLGFGFGVVFGKDFDLAANGVFGLELGFDYKGLNTNAISIKSALDESPMQDYEKSLYHLIYVDLELKYTKFWANNFGLNIGAGIRGNLAPKLATSKVVERINDNTINILLDNDKVLGYLGAGIGYVVEQKSYAMEFGLSYFGNFGDRSMSNGGSLEFRVNF